MKLEPPVPVPVDSIFSWGCADDDLIDSSRFNSCDAADSTTGGAEGLAGTLAGNSAGMLGLSCAQTKGNSNSLLAMDGLDGLLLQSATNASLNNPTTPGPGPGGGHSFAELKPLPPFDYSTISSLESALSNGTSSQGSCSNNNNQSGTRTILDINLNLYKASPAPNSGLFYSEPVSTTSVNGLVSVVPVLGDNGSGSSIRNDGMTDYLMNQDIDIAAIIGNAIADSTVAAASSRPVTDPTEATGEIRDAWADFDAWIESACASVYRNDPMLESPGSSVTSGSSHSSLSSVSPAFLQPPLPPMNQLQQQSGPSQTSLNNSCSVSSTLQALLTQGPNNGASGGPVGMTHLSDHLGGPNQGQNILVKSEPSLDMPLLQRRLTAGRDPPDGLGSSGSSGPNHYSSCSMSGSHKDLQQQLPHTTFHSGHVSTSLPHLGNNDGCHSSSFQTARRSMVKKELNDLDDPLGVGVAVSGAMGGSGKSKHKSRTGKAKMSTIMTTQGDKEKPVHRCNICNRGFLNKSNIKVHLRTHTGEKPFKCDHCAKAFRQKAHLLKHMQIHKRVSRD